MPVLAVGAPRNYRDVGERAIVVVVKQHAGLRVHRHINIGPAIVVEIIRDGCDGISRARLQDSGLLGDIRKSSVAVVVIENVGVARQATRAAHGGNSLPLALRRILFRRSFFRIELDVVADEKIEETIAVVIEPGATGTPADFFVV